MLKQIEKILRWFPLTLLLAFCAFFAVPTYLGGLKGEYFNDKRFEKLLFQRKDHLLYFASLQANRHPGFPKQNFSVRWTGEVFCPRSGIYHFGLIADDGIRLRVADTVVIDYWKSSPPKNHLGSVELKQGWNPIEVEFFQKKGGWVIKLFWAVPEGSMALIPPRYLRP